jgi:hypothetical protein
VTIARPSTLDRERPATFHRSGGVTAAAAGVLADRLDELLAPRQLPEGDRTVGRRVGDLAVRGHEVRPLGAHPSGRQVDQHLARRRGRLAQLRAHGRRRPAAERPGVVGGAVGVAHHEADRGGRCAQLLGDDLRQRRPGVLSHLHFAGVHGDGAVLADVEPGADLLGRRRVPAPAAAAASPAAPGFLLGHGRRKIRRDDARDQDPAAQRPQKPAAVQAETVRRLGGQLVTLRLQCHVVVARVSPVHAAPPFGSSPPPPISAARRTAATIRG